MPSAPVEEAPAATAPEAPAVPEAVSDATGAYERYEFPQPGQETAPPEAAPPDRAAAEPEPEAKAPEPDTPKALTPEEVARLEKDPAMQQRIRQLANNLHGNALQRERERLRAEVQREIRETEAKWVKADAAYQLLVTEGEEAFMDRFGVEDEAAVARWKADYIEGRRNRNAETQAAPDTEAVVLEVRQAFNEQAIGEFRQIAQASLPFWEELPEDARGKLSSLTFDPDGNWLEDAFKAIADGFRQRDERIAREHKSALDEARKAGANQAMAEIEEDSPVITGATGPAKSWKQVEDDYSKGLISREEFNAERKARRIDY